MEPKVFVWIGVLILVLVWVAVLYFFLKFVAVNKDQK